MSTTVSPTSERAPGTLGHLSDDIVPVSSRELFWRTKYLRASPSLAHLPFLFWLIAALRPRRTATLNIGEGVVHFAACQAIEKIGADALCLGFGEWGGTGVPDQIAAYNAEQYSEFSTLAEMSPAKAARRAPKGGIDLLIAEGPLDRPLMDAIMHRWPQRMSDRGAIVLSGLDSLTDQDADKLEKWCEGHRTLRFDHDGGILMIGVGDDGAHRALHLDQLNPESAAFISVERIFARLGASHVNEWEARDKQQQITQLTETLTERENAGAQLKAERDSYARQLEAIEDAQPDAITGAITEAERQEIETFLADADTALTAAPDDAATARRDLDARLQSAEAAQSGLLAETKILTDTLHAAEEERVFALTAAQQQADDALRDLDALRRDVSQAEARGGRDRQGLEARLQSAEAECDSLQDQLAQQASVQAGEMVILSQLLELETGQRIILSEQLAARERENGPAQMRELADIKALTDTLSSAEERALSLGDALKTAGGPKGGFGAQVVEAVETLQIRTREAASMADEITGLRQTAQRLEAEAGRQTAELGRQMAEEKAAIQAVTQAAAQTAAKADQARQDNMTALQGEITKLRVARDTQEVRNQAQAREAGEAQKAAKVTEDDLRQQLSKLKADLRHRDAIIAERAQEVAALEVHRSNLEQSRADLMGSASWRVTQPFRHVSTAFRKLK